jgi:imidazolonepropionase-like amidohydrolase
MRYASPADVSQWVATKRGDVEAYQLEHRQRYIDLRRRLIKALHDSGVGILLGSDAPQTWNVPGFSIHREIAAYVAAGLTPFEALVTGTRAVAAHFGTLDRTGTIEAGKRADLVLLDGNPLQDISNTLRIAGVMIGGRWLPKSEIDRRLNEGR